MYTPIAHMHAQPLPSPSKLTLGQMMARPPDAPASDAERKLATAVVKRISHSSRSTSSSVLSLPTVGQVRKIKQIHNAITTTIYPLTYVRVTQPRVVTTDAGQKTKRRRSSQLTGIRDAISGGAELDKDGRDKLLKDEAFSREISPEKALSLKTTFAWNKIRSMWRYRKFIISVSGAGLSAVFYKGGGEHQVLSIIIM